MRKSNKLSLFSRMDCAFMKKLLGQGTKFLEDKLKINEDKFRYTYKVDNF